MPPRRKERSLEPYFTKSGQGKLFYEPADGPQQASQREQKTRRQAFEGSLGGHTRMYGPADPAEVRKVHLRALLDEPTSPGDLSLRQSLPWDSARISRRYELHRSAGEDKIPLDRVMNNRFLQTPDRFESGGVYGAAPRVADPRDPRNPEFSRAVEQRATAGTGKRLGADIARDLATKTTVPPEDVDRLGVVVRDMSRERSRAHYQPWSQEINVEPGSHRDTSMMTHEVGHHVSSRSPGYAERQEVRTPDPRGETVGPREEAFADDYAATHADPSYRGYGGSFLTDNPEYLSARKVPPAANTPTSVPSNVGQQFEQLASFEVEDAFAPDADAEVQAYTQNEGRDVLGWGPNRYNDPESIYKHEYDPAGEKPFWGANYVSMFNDDVVPQSRRDDWLTQSFRHTDPVVKQTWKSR